MNLLKTLGIEASFIPGGCTKSIQAPDVSWNKLIKEKVFDYYTIWMTNNANKEYAKGGNPKAPALELVLEWVDRAWQQISKDVIAKSFQAYAITTAVDGSEYGKITCFKPGGSIGPEGLAILQKLRAQQDSQDGKNDFEEDGLEYGEHAEENESHIESNIEELYDEYYFMFC